MTSEHKDLWHIDARLTFGTLLVDSWSFSSKPDTKAFDGLKYGMIELEELK